MIRTLIVHHIGLVAELLESAVRDQEDMRVVGTVVTPEEALACLAETGCDVVLLNYQLPDQGAYKLTRMIMQQYTDMRVVITGMLDSDRTILHYLELGAVGYVRDEDSIEELFTTVRCAARGEAMVPPEVVAALVRRVAELRRLATELNGYHESSMEEQLAELTERERQVLTLLGQGLSNRRIADELVITVGTVKNHVHNILDKLDVHTRKQAGMIARQLVAANPLDASDEAPFTWPKEMGVEVKTRREAAAMF